MNIIDLQDNLKNLPENALMQEMQQPTGSAPPFLILGELKRRKQMRDDYNRQQNSDMKTVAEEVVTAAGAPQEGIMQMARSLNPNTNMAQDTGLAQAAPVTPTQAPQPQAPQMMSGGGILRMARGGRFGTDIEYNYKTFLQENNLNDTPYAQDMFARLKETMDNKYATEGPNNNPRIYDNAIGFERSPEGIGSVSSDVSDFMPNSGEFTRPELSLSPQILNELSVEPDAEFTRQTSPAEPLSILDQLRRSDLVGRDYTPTSAELSAQLANSNLLDLRQSQFDVDMSQPKTPNLSTEVGLLELGIMRQEQAQKLAEGKISQSDYDEAIAVLDGIDQEIRTNPFDKKNEDLEYDVKRAADRAFERRTEAGDFDGTILGEGEGGMPIPQTSPAEPLSILDQLRGSVYSSNPLEDALANTGLNSNFIGDDIIDPVMSRFAEAASREGMPSQTAADIANETALRNREMASENAGRLTVEELLAPAPETYDATDKRPRAQGISSFGVFDPFVERFKEIRSEDAARNAAAAEGDLGAFLDVGSENDPAFLSSAMEALSNPSERFQDGFSPMAEVSTLSDDNFINDPNTGYSYPTDVPPLDPEMEGRQVAGRVIDALTEGEGSSLPEDIYGGYENPEAIARRQEIERMISLEPLGEGMQGGVKTVVEDKEPNLITQGPVAPTSDATNRREAAEDGTGIASLNPVVSDDKDSGGSSTSSGGAYGSIESRIAKMLSDRESSAEADKWMALAQTGMALMASKNPTFGGALGEAGLAGVGALQKSRKAYDSDIMSLLGMQQKIQSAKSLDASRSAKSTSGGSKELDRMIDNARADLALANAAAAKYFKVQSGDPLAGTEDRMINMIHRMFRLML